MSKTSQDAGWDYEWLSFDFHRYGAIFDGKCVAVRDLPDFPISHLQTGQWTDGEGSLWSVKIPLTGYAERYRRALADLPKTPAARSDFDIYLRDRTLIYLKTPCAETDTRGRFLLSIYPTNQSDVDPERRAQNLTHNALNFDFPTHGATLDGKCVIIRSLPDYPIATIETGQWLPGEGELWSAQIEIGETGR